MMPRTVRLEILPQRTLHLNQHTHTHTQKTKIPIEPNQQRFHITHIPSEPAKTKHTNLILRKIESETKILVYVIQFQLVET